MHAIKFSMLLSLLIVLQLFLVYFYHYWMIFIFICLLALYLKLLIIGLSLLKLFFVCLRNGQIYIIIALCWLASIIPGNLIIKLFLFIFYLSGFIYICFAVYSRVTQTICWRESVMFGRIIRTKHRL